MESSNEPVVPRWGHSPNRTALIALVAIMLAMSTIPLGTAGPCPTKMETGMETWCIMEIEGAPEECNTEESTPGKFFKCRGSVGTYDGDNGCYVSEQLCEDAGTIDTDDDGEDDACVDDTDYDEFPDCKNEPERDPDTPDEGLPGDAETCHECEWSGGGEPYVDEDNAQCNEVAMSDHQVGANGPESISGGEGGGADEECRQAFKMKICTYLCAFGDDGYTGPVCVDKGYGEPNGGPRPELNLRPKEENPKTKGSPFICNTQIPGLQKPEYEGYEPDVLNVSLLDCPEDISKIVSNYESMADFMDTTIAFYENFLDFYKSLERDLRNIYNAVKKQCNTCESSIENFNEKYGICGLTVEIGDIPKPSVCFQTAKPACADKGACVEGNDGMSMCQALCDAYPCNYGDNCDNYGVPKKPAADPHECWDNEYLCGDTTAIGSKEEHGGYKGCDSQPDGANSKGTTACCVKPCVNEAFDPYAFMNAGCYKPAHIIAEAWHTLETKKSKNSLPSPPKVRKCAHEVADLKDVCELDEEKGERFKEFDDGEYAWGPASSDGHFEDPGATTVADGGHPSADFGAYRTLASQQGQDTKSFRTPCEVEKQMKRILDYLKNVLKEMPRMIAQMREVERKYQQNVEQGATYTLVQEHMNELAAISHRIDTFEVEDAPAGRIKSSDEFQNETTDLLLFLQDDKLLADLTKLRHNYPTEISKFCSDSSIQDIHFPDGTHKNLKYKEGEEPHRQWATFCSNFNVKECGKRPEKLKPGPAPPPPEAKPPIPGCGGYRGGCGPHEPTIADIKDINMDEWSDEHIATIEEIRDIDVKDVFVDSSKCFVHQVPTVSLCEEICDKCYETSVAHCHAQLGLCVCHLGTEWKTTDYECQVPLINVTEQTAFQACCEGMFVDVYTPGAPVVYRPEVPGKPQCVVGTEEACVFEQERCEVPAEVLGAGPLFDFCQMTSAETGLCCRYLFEERSMSYSCAESSTCLWACHDLFGGNPERVIECTRKCSAASVSCDRECLASFTDEHELRICVHECWDERQETYPEHVLDCVRSCPREKREDWDVCARMCKVLAPDLDIHMSALRGDREVQTFFAGEELRFRAKVKNQGFLPFRGRAEVKLKLFDACNCPFCPEGAVCECACEDRYSAILATIPLREVEAGTTTTMLSDPKPMDEDLAGKTVQPVLEVYDEQGRLVSTVKEAVSKVFEMGAVTIQDAHFMVDGVQDTKAYAGGRVKGIVTVTSALFPLTISVSIVDAEGREITGSRASVQVMDVLEGSLLETREIETPVQYVGFVLRLRIEATDSENATVFSETLTEQGLTSNACMGETMTFWCLEESLEFRMDYPDAYLEIMRPELKLIEVVFETRDGLSSPVLYEQTEVRASVIVKDTASIPFEGTVTIAAMDSWSVAVDGSVRGTELVLTGGAEATALSEYFTVQPGTTYLIMVRATDVQGREWAISPTTSGLVSSQLFPLGKLEVREKTTVQGESSFIEHTIQYADCSIRVTCNDCLPTCTLQLDRKRCILRTVPGTCACECVSSPV